MDNYGQEVAEAKIREKLNTDKVKLWLPPYTTAENQKGEMPKVLTKSFVIWFASQNAWYKLLCEILSDPFEGKWIAVQVMQYSVC